MTKSKQGAKSFFKIIKSTETLEFKTKIFFQIFEFSLFITYLSQGQCWKSCFYLACTRKEIKILQLKILSPWSKKKYNKSLKFPRNPKKSKNPKSRTPFEEVILPVDVAYLIRQNFGGQNFRQQVRFSAVLSAEILSDKVSSVTLNYCIVCHWLNQEDITYESFRPSEWHSNKTLTGNIVITTMSNPIIKQNNKITTKYAGNMLEICYQEVTLYQYISYPPEIKEISTWRSFSYKKFMLFHVMLLGVGSWQF